VEELARLIEAELRTLPRPYLVAITGSVAVGKSTMAVGSVVAAAVEGRCVARGRDRR
jgi:pantothenate kinase